MDTESRAIPRTGGRRFLDRLLCFLCFLPELLPESESLPKEDSAPTANPVAWSK